MISACLQTIAAYIVMDALTGIYHLFTDRGWNLKGQCDQFAEHHETNTMDGYDWQPLVGAIPGLACGVWFGSAFLISLSVFAVWAQVPHYFAHHPPTYGPIRWAQWCGLMISPQHHADHHSGEFDRNFCIFTGWNDWWMNAIAWLIPIRGK